MEIKTKQIKSNKIFVGIALIVFGLILLKDSYQINIPDQVFPLLLIGLGVILMIRKRNKELRSSADSHADKFTQSADKIYNKVNDFESKLDEKIDSIDEHINKFDEKINEKFSDPNFKQKFTNEFTGAFNKNGKVKYEKALGDLFINCKGVNVENVEVSSAIGDIEIQMREANFIDGLNRLIVSSFIGDVNIYLPQDLAIFVNCSNFIGDIEAAGKHSTGFGNKVESQSTNYDTATSKLYIASNSFIGDITIIQS